MDIAIIASEVAPFSKSGGMGDVTGALAAALGRMGHRVMTVSPRYGSVDAGKHGISYTGCNVTVPVGHWHHTAGLHATETKENVRHVFVEHGVFHRKGLYGDERGGFGDNHIRFAMLSRAAIEAVRHVEVGGEFLANDTVFHCNDWQTALVPIYLDAAYRPLKIFEKSPTVLTLHNPAHQGRLPSKFFDDLELTARWFSTWGLEFYGDLGLLKGGVKRADKITTVSPTFAREILRPGGGFGLEAVFGERATDLVGILNGIDNNVWNPSADEHLPHAFDVDNLEGKARCKAELQAELGLPVDPSAPLVAAVSRLDPQKGVELIVESIPWLVSEGAQVVVLGSAAGPHKRYEWQLRQLEQRFGRAVRAWIGFSERMAHRIEAAADLFMMPSLFEPCGLNQLYSMRYGTAPVVRATGGLADSVAPFDANADTGTGFVFHAPTGNAFRDAMYRGLHLWRNDREAFVRLQKRAMSKDTSWDTAAHHYVDVYEAAAAKR